MEEERLYDVYALDEDIKICECLTIRTEEQLLSEVEIQALERLIEAYRKVKEENEEMKEEWKAEQKHEMENTIPKSKIKEKIEELKKEMDKDEVDEFGIHSIGWGALDYTIEKLQELLEEE